MTFLPILERELRGRARGRATYWSRSGLALLGVLICLPQLAGSGAWGGVTGPDTFLAIGVAAFLLCCCGCLVTADVVDAERREGTLGLLLLTRVEALDLLCGKLGANGLTGFCALAAFSPLLAIPILGGGVTGGEAFRCGLALVNTLFLSLAVGLFTSVWRQVRGWGAAWAFGLMAVLVGLPWIGTWLPANIGPAALLELKIASPLAALLGGRDYPYNTDPGAFWLALLIGQLMAWLFLAAASYGLRRSLWPGSPTSDRVESLLPAPAHRLQVGDSAPIAWLVQRQPGLKRGLWIAATAMVLAPWTQFFVLRAANWRVMAYEAPFYYICTLVTSCLLAWMASRFFIQARRSGALEALLATPIGAQTVLSGQLAGLRHLIRGPFLLMLASAVGLHFACWVLDKSPPRLPPWSLQSLVLLSLNLTGLLVGLLTMAWVGLWFGLTARNQTSAIFWTVALADVAMGLMRIVVTLLLHAYFKPNPPMPPSRLGWAVSYGFTGLMLLLRVGLMLYARRRVYQRIDGQEPLA
ncbi:MAG TPA: ABC transporter permease subunit [Verrucomicrobiae bacterium]